MEEIGRLNKLGHRMQEALAGSSISQSLLGIYSHPLLII